MENQQETQEQKELKARKAVLWHKLIDLGLEFAVYIALPLFVFIYLGKWADGKLHTKFFVIIGIFLALGLSSYLIYKKIKEIKNLMNDKN